MKLTRKEAEAAGLEWPRKAPGRPARASGDQKAVQCLFLAACRSHGLPEPVAEYAFAHPRKWRFDWLFEGWLALEIQGGLYVNGRHVRGPALAGEYEKLNEAVCRGFAVLFCTPADVESGAIFPIIGRALGTHEEQH